MIVLINMPFSSLFQPSLALSQFKSQLAGDGIPSSLLNLNFEFARRIGFKAYEPLEKLRSVDMRVGEWLFAKEAWGAEFGPDSAAFAELCREGLGILGGVSSSPEWMNRTRDTVVPEFLDAMSDRVCGASAPEAIFFSCTFFQTIPSLALARRIKVKSPGAKIVFGGASMHSEMGEELIAAASCIDAVSTGEADHVICRLARSVLAGEAPEGLDGIFYRDAEGRVCGGSPPRPVDRGTFEALPVPNFDDFIADADAFAKDVGAFRKAPLFLPFESSRGCWWGEKVQCAFCGLNAENIEYRFRSAEGALDLVRSLADRYPIRRFFATDNSLPPRYYLDFLPAVARCPSLDGSMFFYEIKAGVGRKELEALSEAGVAVVQPGIETLSSHILRCMRKGISVLKNIHLLKLCRIFGITPMWNFLIRVPGERKEDYEEMKSLLPALVHLHPPTGGVRMVQLHRFSPYFKERGTYVEEVRAQRWYEGLFPAERVDLMRVAYYFEADWKDVVGREYCHYEEFTEVIERWIEAWRSCRDLPGLSYDEESTGPLEMVDTRSGKDGSWRLDEQEALVYRLIDDPARIEKVEAAAAERGVAPQRARTMLREFTENGLALEEAGTYLGLALPASVSPVPLGHRQDLFRRFR